MSRMSPEELIAERLEMGCLLATAERVTLDGHEASTLASWLIEDLRLAGWQLALIYRGEDPHA